MYLKAVGSTQYALIFLFTYLCLVLLRSEFLYMSNLVLLHIPISLTFKEFRSKIKQRSVTISLL